MKTSLPHDQKPTHDASLNCRIRDGWVFQDSEPGFINVGWNEFNWINENRVVFAANQIRINGQNHGQNTMVAHVTSGEIVISLQGSS